MKYGRVESIYNGAIWHFIGKLTTDAVVAEAIRFVSDKSSAVQSKDVDGTTVLTRGGFEVASVIFIKAAKVFQEPSTLSMIWRAGDAPTRVALLNDLGVYLSERASLSVMIHDDDNPNLTLRECAERRKINVDYAANFFGVDSDTLVDNLPFMGIPTLDIVAADLSTPGAEDFFRLWQQSKPPLAEIENNAWTPKFTSTRKGVTRPALALLFAYVNFELNKFKDWQPYIQAAVFANAGRALKSRLEDQLRKGPRSLRDLAIDALPTQGAFKCFV